ncbi:hypothetical protein MTO96_033324 [Rhipicephalus appendiculatus]
MVACHYSKSFALKALLVLVFSALSFQRKINIAFEEVDVDVNARFGVVVLSDDSSQENEISPKLRSAPAHGRFKRADEEEGGGIEEHHGTIGHDDAVGHTGHEEFSFQEAPIVVTYESDAGETGVPETAVTYEMDSGIAEGGGGGGVTSIGHGSRRYLTPTSGSGGNVRLGRIVYGGGGLRPGYGMIGTQLGTGGLSGGRLAYGLQPALSTSGLALQGAPAMGMYGTQLGLGGTRLGMGGSRLGVLGTGAGSGIGYGLQQGLGYGLMQQRMPAFSTMGSRFMGSPVLYTGGARGGGYGGSLGLAPVYQGGYRLGSGQLGTMALRNGYGGGLSGARLAMPNVGGYGIRNGMRLSGMSGLGGLRSAGGGSLGLGNGMGGSLGNLGSGVGYRRIGLGGTGGGGGGSLRMGGGGGSGGIGLGMRGGSGGSLGSGLRGGSLGIGGSGNSGGLGMGLKGGSAASDVPKSNKPCLQYYKGVPLPGFFPRECIESACKYKPTKDDLYIVTYVKCGTTWTQHVVYLIQTGGVPPSNAEEFYRASPYIEAFGAECVQWMKKPGALKTHLPVQLLEFSPEAKYLVVARNPRDVIVSLQYHWLSFVGYHYNGTFDDAFEHFMNDEIDCGNFFTFYKDWYERSRDPNVLFVVYEDLKRNPEELILRIARFMGEEYEANLLKDDRKRLRDVVKYSSVDEMKKYTNDIIQEFFRGSFDFQGPEYEGFRQFHHGIHSAGVEAANKVNYVRKGIVGDWKNHFTQEQLKRLNEKFKRETEGSDIAKLWPDMNFLE